MSLPKLNPLDLLACVVASVLDACQKAGMAESRCTRIHDEIMTRLEAATPDDKGELFCLLDGLMIEARKQAEISETDAKSERVKEAWKVRREKQATESREQAILSLNEFMTSPNGRISDSGVSAYIRKPKRKKGK